MRKSSGRNFLGEGFVQGECEALWWIILVQHIPAKLKGFTIHIMLPLSLEASYKHE
jgi:hypothetical protein